jgi:hypothetical protein
MPLKPDSPALPDTLGNTSVEAPAQPVERLAEPYFYVPQSPRAQRVLIAYTDRTQFRSLRFLKRGFRHCLTLRQVGDWWILIDGLSNQVALSVMDVRGLAAYLRLLCRHGFRVQTAWTNPSPPKRYTLMPGTCVEIAKRVMGIVSWRIWTPHQLFLHIKRNILTTYDRDAICLPGLGDPPMPRPRPEPHRQEGDPARMRLGNRTKGE